MPRRTRIVFLGTIAAIATIAGCLNNSPTGSNGPALGDIDAGFVLDATSPESGEEAGLPSITILTQGDAATSASGVDFGIDQCGNTNPMQQSLTVQNTGDATLTWQAALSPTNAFSIVGPSSGSIEHGQSGTLTVAVTPIPSTTAAGTTSTATLSVTTNVADHPVVQIPLKVTSGGGTLTVSPASADFGDVPVQSQATDIPVTLTNTGNAPLTIAVAAPSDPQFQLAASGPLASVTLAPGDGVPGLTARFAPTQRGQAQASAAITTTGAVCGASASAIAFTGNGVGGLVGVQPGSIDFAQVSCGAQAAPQTFVVANQGNAPFNFKAALTTGTAYALSTSAGPLTPSTSITVAAGQSATVTVTPAAIPSVSATTPDLYADTITVTTDAPGDAPHVVALHETAQGARISASVASIDFGDVSLSTKNQSPLTLTNDGNAPAHVTMTVTNAAFGASYNQATDEIDPGNPASATVTFAPTSPTVQNGAISLSADPSDVLCAPLPSALTLTGTGTNGALSISASTLDFGKVSCGATGQPQTLTLANTGNGPFSWTTALANGASSAFVVSPASGSLAPQATATLTVTPNPIPATSAVTSNLYGDTLTLTTSGIVGDTPHAIALTESAQGAILAFSPASLAFGQVPTGTSSTGTFKVVNTGNLAANVSLASSAAAFSVAPAGPTLVAAGATLPLTGKFSPTVTGAQSATVKATVGGNDVLCAPLPSPASLGGTGTSGAVAISASSIDFGLVACGATAAAQTLTISNTGSASFTFTTALAAGAASPYTVSPATGTVAPNGSATITVTPNAVPATSTIAPKTDTLTVTTTVFGDSPHAIALSETPQGAILGVSPASIAFGAISLNQSTSQTLTVSNTGNAPAIVSFAMGTGSSAFTAGPQNHTLLANDTFAATATFKPTASGAQQNTASVAVAPGTPLCAPLPAAVALTGTGNVGVASVTPGSLGFGLVACGTTAAAQNVTLSNTGTASFNYTAALAAGGSSAYAVSPTSGSVAPGAKVTLSVTPLPVPQASSIAPLTDSLVVTTDIPNDTSKKVALSETPQGAILAVSPNPVAFGGVKVNTTGTTAFALKNTGNAAANVTLSVSGGAGAFSVSPTTATVAASSSSSVNGTFAPTTSGAQQASLDVAVAPGTALCGPAPASTPMTGNGTVGALSLSTSSIDFGAVNCGATASARAITLTNSGQASFSWNASLGLGASSPYAISPASGTIAAGASATLTVTPSAIPAATSIAAKTDTISITTDIPSDTTHAVTLSETPRGVILSVSTTNVAFGGVNVGASGTKPITVSNTGNVDAPLTLGLQGSSSAFALSPATQTTVTAQGTLAASATFTPTVGGAASSSATLSLPAGTPTCGAIPGPIALSGTGNIGVAKTSVSSLAFGNVSCGTQAAAQTFTLSNSGTASFTWNAAMALGASSPYAVSPASGSIAAGGSATLTVTPAAIPSTSSIAPLDDSVSITTNIPGDSAHVVSVSETPSGAILAVTPSAYDFGGVAVNTTATHGLSVSNTGNASATVSFTTGSGSSAFTVGPASQSVAGGASGAFTASFAPTSGGSLSNTAQIAVPAGTALCSPLPGSVSLTGTGNVGVATISPSTIDFGAMSCGGSSATKTVTVSNTGNAVFSFTAALTTGTAYAVSPTSGTVNPGQSTTLTVTAKAIALPSTIAAKTDTLTITTSNIPGDHPHTVGLTLSPQGAILGLSTTSVAIGNVPVGQSGTGAFVVTNTGNVGAVVSYALGSGNSVFSVSPQGQSVAAQGTQTETVTFAPTQASSSTNTATLSVPNGTVLCAALPGPVNVSGTGTIGVAKLSTTAVSFGSVTCGTAASATTVTLSNTGSASFTWNAALASGTNYTISPTSGTVAAGGSVNVTVTPSTVPVAGSVAALTDTLTFTTNIPGDSAHAVSITETPSGAILTESPSTINFGNVSVSSSSTQAMTVKNVGNVAAQFAFTIGSGSTSITVPTSSQSLAAGGTTSVNATFAPTQSGSFSNTATLGVPNGTALCGPLPSTISLTGTGTIGVAGVSPGNVDFGLVNCGSAPSGKPVVISNTGTASFTFTASLNAGASSPFALTVPSTTVAANGSVTLTVSPQPVPAAGSIAALTDTLHITTSIPGDTAHDVPLSLTPQGAILAVSTGTEPFGNVLTGQSSTLPLTVTNTGNVTATVSFTMSGSAAFAVGPSGQSVTASSPLSATATFHPTTPGALTATATLSAALPAGMAMCGAIPAPVSLSGTGTSGAISLSASSVDLGAFACGSTPTAAQSATITVTNTGTAPFTFTPALAAGAASQFSFTTPNGTTVAANGGTASIVVASKAIPNVASVAALVDTLQVTTNIFADSAHNVGLSVTPSGAILSFSPSSIPFGNVTSGQTASQSLTITNSGNAAISGSLASSNGAFTVSPSSMTNFGPGSATTTVKFAPTNGSAQTGALTPQITAGNVCGPLPSAVSLSGQGQSGVYAASGSSFPFGTTDCGLTAAAQSINLTNSGNLAYTFNAGFSGTSGAYTVTPSSGTVNPGAQVTVTVTPKTIGTTYTSIPSFNDGLNITTNIYGDGNHAYPITQTANGVLLSFSQTSFSFAATPAGQTASIPFTVTNAGTVAASLAVNHLSDDHSHYYRVTDTSGNPTISVAAGSSIGAQTTFIPPGGSTYPDSTYSVAFSGVPVCGGITSGTPVPMNGSGLVGAVSLSTSSIDFGNVNCGASVASQTVTVTNTGTYQFDFTPSIVDGAVPGVFSVSPSTTQTLAPGASTTLTVSMAPLGGLTSVTSISGGLDVATNIYPYDPTYSVPLNVNPQGPVLVASPSSYAFGQVTLGSSAQQTITLSNNGNQAATFSYSSNNGSFYVQNPGIQSLQAVPAGGSLGFTAGFSPGGNINAQSATATPSAITNNCGAPPTISLSGSGLGGIATLSTTSVNFGSPYCNTQPGGQTVTLTNTGNQALNWTGYSNTSHFYISAGVPSWPYTLNAGASISFTLQPYTVSTTTPGTEVYEAATIYTNAPWPSGGALYLNGNYVPTGVTFYWNSPYGATSPSAPYNLGSTPGGQIPYPVATIYFTVSGNVNLGSVPFITTTYSVPGGYSAIQPLSGYANITSSAGNGIMWDPCISYSGSTCTSYSPPGTYTWIYQANPSTVGVCYSQPLYVTAYMYIIG
jgi:hypothetical protein